MPNLFNGIVKLTEQQYNYLKTYGSITVGDITLDFDENTLYVTDYAIDTELDINSSNPVSNSTITQALQEKTSNGVTLDTNQEISGNKNFVGNITKNGVNVATINEVPKVVDSLINDSSTSALSAKQGKILNDKISSLVATTNGRISTFTVQSLSELLNLFDYPMQDDDKGLESYVVGKDQIVYKEDIVNLMSGDIFFIVDINTPDYWYSLEDKTLYQLETRKIDLSLYALKSEIPTTLPASDVYSWAKEPNKPNYDFDEIKEVPDWVKSSSKPTYTADEVGALSKLPDNVVLTDGSQTIAGQKVFTKVIETGKNNISEKSGFSNVRMISNDNNNVHQTELYVDENGNTKITHKNRTLNSSGDDSYISFNHDKLKYVTGGSEGTTATTEYDIITSKGGELAGPLVVKGGSKTSGVIVIKEQGQIISDEGDYCLLGRLDKTLTVGTTAYPLRLRGSEETFKYNNLEGALRSDNAYQFANDKYVESANLFDGIYDLIGQYINPSTGQYANASGYKASSKLYPINTNKIYFKISEPSRNMVLLFYDANGSYLNEYVSLNNQSSYVYTIQGNAKYFKTYTAEENNANIMISATDLLYQPYNQKRQITNAQANTLKELHNKTKNKFDISRMVFDPSYSNATINADGSITVRQRGNTTDNHLGDFADLEVGKTYIFTFKTTGNENRFYFSKSQTYWYSGEKRTITQNDLDSNIMWYGIADETHTLSEIMISEDGGEYYPYNKVVNITNPQAEFLKEKYEEQVNLFDEIVTVGYVDNNTGSFTETSGGTNLFSFKYFPMKPNTTYSYKTSKSGLWIYEYDANKNFLGYVDIVSGSSFTSKSNTAYFRVAFWGGYGTTYLNDAIVKEGTNPVYHPYNSSSHITNGQADFIKNSYEKSLNLFNIRNLPSSFGENGSAVVNYNNETITITNQYDNYSQRQLKYLAPSVVVGKEYIINATATNTGNTFIYLAGTNESWIFGTPRVLTQQDLDSSVMFYGDAGVTVTIKNIQIEEGNVAHEHQTYQGGKFVQQDQIINQITGKVLHGYDLNTCYNAGLYLVSQGTNYPSNLDYGSLFVMPYRTINDNNKSDYGTQIYLPNGDMANEMWFRTSLANTWNPWKKVSTAVYSFDSSTGTLSITDN